MGSDYEQVLLDSALATRGHFLYESGHHGDLWLDLVALFMEARSSQFWLFVLSQRVL